MRNFLLILPDLIFRRSPRLADSADKRAKAIDSKNPRSAIGHRGSIRQVLPWLLLLAILVATTVRDLIIRRHNINTAARLYDETGKRTEGTVSTDPCTATDQGPAIRQFLPVLLLIGPVFIAAGAAVIIIRYRSTNTPESALFANTNQFGEWVAIVSVVTGISAAIASSTWPSFRRVRKDAGHRAFTYALTIYILIGLVVVIGPFLVEGRGNASYELSNFELRILLLIFLLLAAAAPSFCGLVLLWYSQRAHTDDVGAMAGATISAISSTRRDLQRFFVGATVLITGAVIIIGGLRSTLNAFDEACNSPGLNLNNVSCNEADISVGALILYGAFFAALLALVLAPAYTAWQTRATSFRDHLYSIPEDGHLPKDWYEGRSDLENLLGMNLGSTSRFLTITGILAPLIGSIITVIIPAIHS